MYALSLSIALEPYGLAVIGFSTGLIPRQRPLSITASIQRFLMNSPLPLNASVRITRESCGWRQKRGYTGLIPPAAEPHDILTILMIPAALLQIASILRRRTGRGDCGWQALTGWTSWTPRPEKWCAVPRFMPKSGNFTKMNLVSSG